MAKQDPNADPNADPEEGEGGADPIDWEAKYREAIKHARTWEKRATENQKAADRLKEIEEADKSDLQKALEAQKAAEEKVAALERGAELDRARAKVAAETGVPAEFITGEDEDSMREYASKLASHFKPDAAPKVPGAGKIARKPSDDPEEAAKRELANAIFKRQ